MNGEENRCLMAFRQSLMKRRPRDLVIVAALAIAGGWSAASGLMAYCLARVAASAFPDSDWIAVMKKVEENTNFIFFPPLFGFSVWIYLGSCFSIWAVAYGVVLLKRANGRVSKP